ncbi:unnamed protein product [Diabrotica balteata]|uniref:Uncharacterized protein n=1 Tax=Diabrotica balteata TaxID=107213 RepID=A0A9N9XD66_DIABA|nr:unnamed protein product [Diabrotica balteata]
MKDKRGRLASYNKTPDKLVQKVEKHIESFPTMESHYCRKSSNRLYLDPNLSISKMFKLYVEQYKSREKAHMDQCEMTSCDKYKTKTINKEDYKQHLQRRDEAVKAKKSDKLRSAEEKTF